MSTMRRKLSVPVLIALLGLAVLAGVTPARADLPPLIDRELFFGDPQISGAQLSPNGEWITFVKPYKDVRNIWVKKREEPFDAAKPLTADERPVVGYFWSEDSRYVLYVQDKGGNENWHVYAVDPAGAPEAASGVPSARDLTPVEGARATIYALPESKPDVILVGLNDRDPMFSDVYTVSIATGERTLLIKNMDSVGGYTFDLDGNVRMAMKQKEDGGSQYFRVEGEKLVPIYEVSYLESAGPIMFTRDGKKVYFETNKGDDVDLSRLTLMDPMTGQTELVESDPENQVDFGAPLFDSKTYELIGTVYEGDRQRIYARTPEFERDLKLIREKLPPGNIGLGSSTKDMRWHVIAIQSDVDPGSVYLYDRQSGEFTLLYKSRPDLPSENLAEMKAVRYKARDGMEIPALLTLPKGIEAKNLPLVMYPHGGPWARDEWGYEPNAQFLANRGYAVIQPNFRTSTGYGKKFLNAGNHEWGTGAMQHDLTDGVQWLIKEGIADPKRVTIFGGSYGGYATLAGVTFTPDLYKCGIPYVAPSNLITLMESFPTYWRPFLKGSWYLRVGDPADPEDRKDLEARSPINFVDRIKVPLLVVHGANDPRVKQAESDRIVVSLRDKGMPVEYIVAPDEGHGFRSPENRMALAVSMERFLGKHLGGRVQQDVPEKIAARLKEITVDPASVKLPDAAAVAVAETAKTSALPALDGSLIKAGKFGYTVNIEAGGQKMELTVTRTIDAIKDAGRACWSVNDVIETPMGMQESTLLLDRKTLMPISQAASGMGSIKLQYAADKISGELVGGGQTLPVDVKLDAPVWTDGSGLALAVATLPLAEGYTATVRMFEVNSQKVRTMKLAVVGSDITSSGAGSFQTFVVELTPLDDEQGGGMKSWVTRETPHIAVRGEQKMPSMGGATMTTTLTSMTPAAGAGK
jgi:dipeptidyl aminopeptidase/acylaminoacyl peptidase